MKLTTTTYHWHAGKNSKPVKKKQGVEHPDDWSYRPVRRSRKIQSTETKVDSALEQTTNNQGTKGWIITGLA